MQERFDTGHHREVNTTQVVVFSPASLAEAPLAERPPIISKREKLKPEAVIEWNFLFCEVNNDLFYRLFYGEEPAVRSAKPTTRWAAARSGPTQP